jgi:hypothetical protein
MALVGGSPRTHWAAAEMVEAMADEAGRGYDVEEIVRRRRGRPPMGSAASTVESVRPDPERLLRSMLAQTRPIAATTPRTTTAATTAT